ncbi:MAG: hypothetical protein ACYDAN_04255 [Candidatus Limnocylindrales bacterium]
MPSPTSAAGEAGFPDVGPVRGVRVSLRDRVPAEADDLSLAAFLAVGLVGLAMGLLSSDPALFIAWLR